MSKKHKNWPDNSPIVTQRDKIKQELQIKEFPWTLKQKELIELILNKETKVVLIKGFAGTGKNLVVTYCGLKLLSEKRISDVKYIRLPAESSSYGIGFLSGDLSEKMQPYSRPLEDKLLELLPKNEVNNLEKDNRIESIPIGFLRGLSFNVSYIIADECSNFSTKDFTLLLTRLGKFSKIICIGDMMQTDVRDSGFDKVYNIFNNEESRKQGIHTFELTDIMRNESLGFIIEKLNLIK